MKTLELFANVNGQIVPHFDGATFEKRHDQERLGAQLKRVQKVMASGEWKTLEEISEITGDQMQSISARLRDFRKTGHTVERRRRGMPSLGVFEYKVLGLKEADVNADSEARQNLRQTFSTNLSGGVESRHASEGYGVYAVDTANREIARSLDARPQRNVSARTRGVTQPRSKADDTCMKSASGSSAPPA